MTEKNRTYLDKAGNRIPFSVPENYFEGFALEMDQQIGAAQVTVKRMVTPWMYMAAMFVGVFILGNVIFNIYQENKRKHAEMYEMYIISQLDDSALMEYYYNSYLTAED